MNWPSECAVVIPCADEARTISGLVSAVRKILPNVIVIDDGSIDDTTAQATMAGADVIRHTSSRGKGAALSAGWHRATERGFKWVFSMDGDGQHAPEDIPKFLAIAGQGNLDLVVGNRMANAERMPWLRRRVNQWMSWRLSSVAGMDLPDSQCGFRLMRLGAWQMLSLQTEHFEVESEVLLEFAARNYRISFVPVQVIYKDERSKIRALPDTVRWFRWWREARTMSANRSRPLTPALSPDGSEGERAAAHAID